MQSFFKKEETIEYHISPKTAGYDIHYAIPEGEDKSAEKLKKEVLDFLETYQKEYPTKSIYITGVQQTSQPLGPWKSNMWGIQLFTINAKNEPHHPSATDHDKIRELSECVQRAALFAKKRMVALNLKGTLLVHENVWPEDSDMKLERSTHFDTAWTVHGSKVDFKDIWKTLIPMEISMRKLIEAAGENWKDHIEQIIRQFKIQFADNDAYQGEELNRAAHFLIKGYENLNKMNDEIMKKEKTSIPTF